MRRGYGRRMRITRPISLVTFVFRTMQNPTDTYPGFKTEDDRKAALTVSPLSRRCVQTPRSFSTGNYSGSSPHCHPLGVASHSLRSGSSPPKLRGTSPPSPPKPLSVLLWPLRGFFLTGCCAIARGAWRNRGLRRKWRRTGLMSGAIKKLAQPQQSY